VSALGAALAALGVLVWIGEQWLRRRERRVRPRADVRQLAPERD
jgi:hypothetical protein